MADLAEDIAERAIAPGRAAAAADPGTLQRMTDLTTTMVRQSLDAFVNLDSRRPGRHAAWTTRWTATTTRSSTRSSIR